MAAHPTCRAQKFPLFKDEQMQFCELKKKKKRRKSFHLHKSREKSKSISPYYENQVRELLSINSLNILSIHPALVLRSPEQTF